MDLAIWSYPPRDIFDLSNHFSRLRGPRGFDSDCFPQFQPTSQSVGMKKCPPSQGIGMRIASSINFATSSDDFGILGALAQEGRRGR